VQSEVKEVLEETKESEPKFLKKEDIDDLKVNREQS